MSSSGQAGAEGLERGPVFIDVEASALVNGYPIEVGWAIPEVTAAAVRTDAVLIDPKATSWLTTYGWDPQAEKLHGLTVAYLVANGMHPSLVAGVLDLALGVRKVYSDNPDADGRWIAILYAEAGLSSRFTIASKSAATLITELADAQIMGDLDYTAAEREARKLAGQRHRAGPDAAYWAYLWLLVTLGFKAPPDARLALGPLRRRP